MRHSVTGISCVAAEKNQELVCFEESMRRALIDSKIKITDTNRNNIGIFLGTTFSNFCIRKNNFDKLDNLGIRTVNPADFPRLLISYLGGYLSIKFGTKGAMSVLSSGLSSGLDALQQALFFLQRDKKNIAFVIDLDENRQAYPSFMVKAATCFICESIGSKSRKKTYANIIKIESFFEKKDKISGLCECIKKALKVCSSRKIIPQHFLSSGTSSSRRYVLEKKALQGICKDNKIKLLPTKNISDSSLRAIHSIFKNKISCRSPKENLPVSLCLNIGEDVNSVCMIIQ